MKNSFVASFCAGLLLLGTTPVANSDLETFNATDRGSYFLTSHLDEFNPATTDSSTVHAPNNYTVGRDKNNATSASNYNIDRFRAYFVFDLGTGISDVITAANLHIYNPVAANVGFASPTTVDLAIYDFTGPVSNLTGGYTGVDQFSDLGGGTEYGSVVVQAADQGLYIDIPLNATMIADLQNGTGNYALGARSNAEDFVDSNAVFNSRKAVFWATNSSAPVTRLVLTITPAPPPSPLPLEARDLDGNSSTIEAYYDPILNITWAVDANINSFGTWDDQNTWAANLTIGSVSGWRLPKADVNGDGTVVNCFGGGIAGCDDNEMGYLHWEEGITFSGPGPFSNVLSTQYWSGTEGSTSTVAHFFVFNGGGSGEGTKTGDRFAWAVHDGDVGVAPVVAPASVAAPSASLISLAVIFVGLFVSGFVVLSRTAKRH